MTDSDIDITDLLSSESDQDDHDKFTPKLRKKPKIRTRPHSATTNTMRKFEKLSKLHRENMTRKRKKIAKYHPNKWFDIDNISKDIDDFRDENYKLRQNISQYKKEILTLKSHIKTMEKQNIKKSKELETLITVALENNKQKIRLFNRKSRKIIYLNEFST